MRRWGWERENETDWEREKACSNIHTDHFVLYPLHIAAHRVRTQVHFRPILHIFNECILFKSTQMKKMRGMVGVGEINLFSFGCRTRSSLVIRVVKQQDGDHNSPVSNITEMSSPATDHPLCNCLLPHVSLAACALCVCVCTCLYLYKFVCAPLRVMFGRAMQCVKYRQYFKTAWAARLKCKAYWSIINSALSV